MKTIRIFIASSSELKEDREKFKLFIGLENDRLVNKGIYLKLEQWEYFKDSISSTRLQDEYNEAIRKSDMVICLFYTKVGKYTAEEFYTAYEIFKAQGKPRIWTYFKNADIKMASIVKEDMISLFALKEKFGELGHFYTEYTSIDDLLVKYGRQLNMILPEYETSSDAEFVGKSKEDHSKQQTDEIENTFNDELTPRLLVAISNFNKKAAGFLEANSDWKENEALVKTAKRIIISEYVGVIGSQIRKLMSIGAEDFSESKMLRYLENCQITAIRGLQLVCYALISTLWDHQLAKKIEFSSSQNDVLIKFFRNAAEEDILGFTELLKHLLEIFSIRKLEFLISESSELLPKLQEGSGFLSACTQLNDLSQLLKSATFQLNDCLAAERNVATVLESLSFLAQYRMISINEIDYNQQRNDEEGLYLHNYTLLIGESLANDDSQSNVRRESSPVISHAVIIFKDNYRKNINLDPFIIDFNGLKLVGGSKICFYSHADTYDDLNLNYRFIEDNSKEFIRKSTNPKPNDSSLNVLNSWLSKKTNRIDMNFDKVYSLFFEAKKTLTGIEEESIEDMF
ncbi:hypothetical protein LV84_00048 [Algoriphagus ratkowskyi]|uniref:Uncharacterized protein n=1 Tax=Algoriphagus ratkowskyi TaxID=57028 RepID=A0A2W7RR78_9BACT|nr:hypothetical protein [Algoriphagus ratkowskyi]PZX61060.1 hypothetical protein LV84_00048 [Algoriphagus ratkowskyi]TXD79196.1 hypothetical protein ESW18_02870 [Algoriphagus ratkowskyi]